MTTVVGRAWGWALSWGGSAMTENNSTVIAEPQKHSSDGFGFGRWTSWIWGGWRCQNDESSSVEEYWEAQEMFQPMDTEDLSAGGQETVANLGKASRLWNFFPTSYLLWLRKTPRGQSKCDGQSGDVCEHDTDGDFSDYGTPPPSPASPSSELKSPFRLFAHSWKLEVLPEHHEICFNFLRHLFDLFVVGFLWTVSPPAKLILEVLGVQGALRLWVQGMAMFFVSTVGMSGLLWLIQEYLLQFAIIYGIIQALVISVSIRQSGIPCKEDKEEKAEEGKKTDKTKDIGEIKKSMLSVKDKVKTS